MSAGYSPLDDTTFGEPGPLDADDFGASRHEHELEHDAEKQPEDSGQDTVEEAEYDSDAEVEGLLGNGKSEGIEGSSAELSSSKRVSRALDPGGSHFGSTSGGLWGGRGTGGMSKVEKALFTTEMFSQVRRLDPRSELDGCTQLLGALRSYPAWFFHSSVPS